MTESMPAMDRYICTVVAEFKSGAKITYEATVTAGSLLDAAEKCKLRARLDLHGLELLFSLYVDVRRHNGQTTSWRID